MCRYMNEVLQAVKSALTDGMTGRKIVIAVSSADLVNAAERDVIRLIPEKCRKIKAYPGYDVCRYEITINLEVFVRNRPDAISLISDISCEAAYFVNQMSVNIEEDEFIGVKSSRCKAVEFPKEDASTKNKIIGKIHAIIETFEEQEDIAC